MKNPILGIENTYLGSLFKRISIFEKKLNCDSKFLTLDFYAIFTQDSVHSVNDFLKIRLSLSILTL